MTIATLTMPKLSPTMESGIIVKWHKKEGDQVKAGEVLMEVSTDKATVEHEALDDCYLRKILVLEGEEAILNQPIAVVTDAADTSLEGYEPPSFAVAEEEESVEELEEATATASAPRRPTGSIATPDFVPAPPVENYAFPYQRGRSSDRFFASPAAKRLAKEQNLDLTAVRGSGPSGRIMTRDLQGAPVAGEVSFGPGSIPETQPGSYKEESLTPMRAIIATRLQQAKSFIPHFYVKRTVQVDALVDIRLQLISNGLKLSVNDFVLRAVALSLKKHPEVNSGFNSRDNKIISFSTIDLSMAVSVPDGLVTPILRHADYKKIGELAAESRALATKAREGKLLPEEMKGGSFTVSNLGMFGVDEFTAVLNPPQAAILAVGTVRDAPVVEGGHVRAGKTMSLVLSADHRVVDGAAGALFLQTLSNYLEHPAVLMV